MTSTYVAWNGQAYAWPPPDGWYEAHDGRWWPHGVGPDGAEPQSEPQQRPQPQPQVPDDTDQSTVIPHRADWPTSTDDSEIDPATDPHPSDPEPDRPSEPSAQPESQTSHQPEPPEQQQPLPGADAIPEEVAPTERSWTMIALAAAGVGCVAILAIVFASLGGDGTETEAGTETSDQSDSGVTNPTSDDSSPVLAVDGSESTTTLTTPPTTVTSATAVDTTVDLEVAQAEEAERAEQVERFRDLLTDEGFSGDLLADADIVEFATSFCLFVVAAEDYDDYVSLRDEAIAGSASELGAAELAIAVDRAVEVFCAEDAGRLGIGQQPEQAEPEG